MSVVNDGELGIQHTGNNVAEIAEFIGSTFFEYSEQLGFMIPNPAGTLRLKQGEWLIKTAKGTFEVRPDVFVEATKKPVKKKRGSKK